MSDTYNPGSSPPEISHHPAESQWEEVKQTGERTLATWTQIGVVPGEVEWEEALEYAAALYRYVYALPEEVGQTRNGTCLAAALVSLFEVYLGNGIWSNVQSLVCISTIPRGLDRTSVHGRLSDPTLCHPAWKGHSYYWVEVPAKEKGGKATMVLREGPTRIHAEDGAIDLMLRQVDQLEAAQLEAQNAAARGRNARGREAEASGQEDAPLLGQVRWLGDMSMLVYGVKSIKVPGPLRRGRPTENWEVTPEGQVWPCGPLATEPYNPKQPCCQDVLDRMRIKWRFGIIPPKEPTPEPQLPSRPPGYYGDGGDDGSGGGGSGGYHPGYASGPSQPTSYGSHPWTSGGIAAADAYVQNVIACRTAAAKRKQTPVHTSRPRKPNREAILRSWRKPTHRPDTILRMFQRPVSLSDSLAKLSLGGRPTLVQQPNVRAAYPQPAQPKHAAGVGGRVMRPQGHISSTTNGKIPGAAKKPPSTGPQVALSHPHSRTAAPAGQQGAARDGRNGVSPKTVPAGVTRRYYQDLESHVIGSSARR